MKGDVGHDIECPICHVVLHPRLLAYRRDNRVYHATVSNILKKALHQHLVQVHVGLSTRERSLILDQAVHEQEAVLA